MVRSRNESLSRARARNPQRLCMRISLLLRHPGFVRPSTESISNTKAPMNKPELDNRARHVHHALKLFKYAALPLLLVTLTIFFGCKGSLATYHGASDSVMINGMAY